jgi:hypothetical protein
VRGARLCGSKQWAPLDVGTNGQGGADRRAHAWSGEREKLMSGPHSKEIYRIK